MCELFKLQAMDLYLPFFLCLCLCHYHCIRFVSMPIVNEYDNYCVWFFSFLHCFDCFVFVVSSVLRWEHRRGCA